MKCVVRIFVVPSHPELSGRLKQKSRAENSLHGFFLAALVLQSA
jgi:hypothetical protein